MKSRKHCWFFFLPGLLLPLREGKDTKFNRRKGEYSAVYKSGTATYASPPTPQQKIPGCSEPRTTFAAFTGQIIPLRGYRMAKDAILSTVWISYGDDGILRLKMQEGAHVDLENIKLQHQMFRQLAGDEKLLVLIDGRASFTTSKEAYAYLSENSNMRIATAVLTSNPISRAMINTYITVFRPSSPYRLFTNEAKAVEWLKEMKAAAEKSR